MRFRARRLTSRDDEPQLLPAREDEFLGVSDLFFLLFFKKKKKKKVKGEIGIFFMKVSVPFFFFSNIDSNVMA